MNMNKFVSILILSLVFFMGVQYLIAEEIPKTDEISKEVSNNISEEFVTCAAYFSIASEAIRRSNDPETATKMERARDASLRYALIAAKNGRTAEMAEKVTIARFDLNMKSMTNEIDNDIGNISILMNKYAGRCKEIMESPEKMMAEWTDKVLRKHNLK